ncbi:hypothetical protein IE077_003269 [Cardiosporidium cionae]|uniref:CRAL-TRIO domain-containing protein n=1 Tax=Cardiosporidium cionae TaxID=476202 RepID=A0ABQ7J8Q8_9APIC|nr:hypothetical protein IE077_003269 [Cardiosporidium cionae]|eukprot:KAF8820353.1 hypothetical protein IE077_003269 [Cardiosporidium cionae]
METPFSFLLAHCSVFIFSAAITASSNILPVAPSPVEKFLGGLRFLSRKGEGFLTVEEWKRLYGLYKVSIDGPCNVVKPPKEDEVASILWEEWFRASFHAHQDSTIDHFLSLLSSLNMNWENDEINNPPEATALHFNDIPTDSPHRVVRNIRRSIFNDFSAHLLGCTPAEALYSGDIPPRLAHRLSFKSEKKLESSRKHSVDVHLNERHSSTSLQNLHLLLPQPLLRGTLFKETSKTIYKSWKEKYFVLEENTLKYFHKSTSMKPLETIYLKDALLEGLFSPDANSSFGTDLWSFVIRWKSTAGCGSSAKKSLISAEWEALHAGMTNFATAHRWYDCLKAAIQQLEAPFSVAKILENNKLSYFVENPLYSIIDSTYPYSFASLLNNATISKKLKFCINSSRKDLHWSSQGDWELIHSTKYFRLFRHRLEAVKWKMVACLSLPQETVLKLLIDPSELQKISSSETSSHTWERVKFLSFAKAEGKGYHVPGDVYTYHHPFVLSENRYDEWAVLQNFLNICLHYNLERYMIRESSEIAWLFFIDASSCYQTFSKDKKFSLPYWYQSLFPKNRKDWLISIDYSGWKVERCMDYFNSKTIISCTFCLSKRYVWDEKISSLFSWSSWWNWYIRNSMAIPFNFFYPLYCLANISPLFAILPYSLNFLQNSRSTALSSNSYGEKQREDTAEMQIFGISSMQLHDSHFQKLSTMMDTFASYALKPSDCTRFLSVNNWDLHCALSHLMDYFEWRTKNRIWFLQDRIKKQVSLKEMACVQGYDREKHPCICLRCGNPSLWNKDAEELCQILLFLMETAVAQLSFDSDQVVVLLDAENFSLASVNFQWFLQISPLFKTFYPERLHHIYIYNVTKDFYLFWITCLPFIPFKTRDKITFLPMDADQCHTFIEKNFTLASLPPWCHLFTVKNLESASRNSSFLCQ